MYPSQNDKKIRLGSSNLLAHDPRHTNNTYGFLVYHAEKQLKIHFEVTVRFVTRESNGLVTYFIDRKQVFLNNDLPGNHGTLYEIADEMAKAIYPVIIRVNHQMKIIDLMNHAEIISRCQNLTKKMNGYYIGEIADDIFFQFKRHIENKQKIIAGLASDLFMTLYFFPLYTKYPDDYFLDTTSPFNVAKEFIPSPFSITQKLQPNYSGNGKLIVDVMGKELKNTNGNEIYNHQSFNAQYLLYPEDHAIFSITGEAGYLEENGRETVLFELYHLNTEERKVTMRSPLLGGGAPSKDNIIISQETVKPKKKKGFFDFF